MIWFVVILWGSVYLLTHSVIMSPLRLVVLTTATKLLRPTGHPSALSSARAIAAGKLKSARAFLVTTAIAGMYCEACTGFWIGGVIALLGHWPLEVRFWAPAEAAVISAGLMAIVAEYGPRGVYDREQKIVDGALSRQWAESGAPGFGTLSKPVVHTDMAAAGVCGCDECVAEREYRENNMQ